MKVRIAPGVYKDEFGEYHINETEIAGYAGPSVDGVGDEDFGDDPEFGIDEADSAFGDDDAAAMAYLSGEIGRTRNPKRQAKLKKNFTKRAGRLEKKAARKGVDLDIGDEPEDKVNKWEATAVSGTATSAAGGTEAITIRLQHAFKAEDIRAIGLASSKVTEIRFGDRTVWSSITGVDIAFLGAASFLTGLLKGQLCPRGLDVTISVKFPGAGTTEVVLVGSKPANCP